MRWEPLDGGRRTDAKRGDKTQRVAGRLGHYYERSADKERSRPIHRATKNSRMGHGADRTIMAGKLGIVGVNVNSLDDTDEGNEQDTKQRQSYNRRLLARFVSREDQNQCPTLTSGTQPGSRRMHRLAGKLPDPQKGQSPKSSRKRLVWARLTGISVCFLSSRRN